MYIIGIHICVMEVQEKKTENSFFYNFFWNIFCLFVVMIPPQPKKNVHFSCLESEPNNFKLGWHISFIICRFHRWVFFFWPKVMNVINISLIILYIQDIYQIKLTHKNKPENHHLFYICTAMVFKKKMQKKIRFITNSHYFSKAKNHHHYFKNNFFWILLNSILEIKVIADMNLFMKYFFCWEKFKIVIWIMFFFLA